MAKTIAKPQPSMNDMLRAINELIDNNNQTQNLRAGPGVSMVGTPGGTVISAKAQSANSGFWAQITGYFFGSSLLYTYSWYAVTPGGAGYGEWVRGSKNGADARDTATTNVRAQVLVPNGSIVWMTVVDTPTGKQYWFDSRGIGDSTASGQIWARISSVAPLAHTDSSTNITTTRSVYNFVEIDKYGTEYNLPGTTQGAYQDGVSWEDKPDGKSGVAYNVGEILENGDSYPPLPVDTIVLLTPIQATLNTAGVVSEYWFFPPVQNAVTFWAKISGAVAVGGRWAYTWQQAEKYAAGYAGWQSVSGGASGSSNAYNSYENATPVNFYNPVPVGAIVEMSPITVAGTTEYWFNAPIEQTCVTNVTRSGTSNKLAQTKQTIHGSASDGTSTIDIGLPAKLVTSVNWSSPNLTYTSQDTSTGNQTTTTVDTAQTCS